MKMVPGLDSALNAHEHARATRPVHAFTTGVPRPLLETDRLVLPFARRMVTHYATDAAGAKGLHLYYGDRQISFDEPELFVFGESLARQTRFTAGSALTWGDGLRWDRVRDLLERLIAEGILRYALDEDTGERNLVDAGVRPSPLAAAATSCPRTWWESEAITAELAGRPIEVGYLELIVPIFRIAHMALDQEGRQVGESNVFPPALRLDIPTRWRTCIYEGTRYQVDRPMNVSALKSMRAHWGQMMGALLEIRAAYLDRFPAARNGWTVGHLERLSTSVLALPTWLLMRGEAPIGNGALHPALSSLFRVTDGLRMTVHQMLFVPIGEPTLAPDAPMTSAEIFSYAERNYSFHSEHGVCAGPRTMIEEFLAVLVDGTIPRNGLPEALEAPLRDALADIEPAIDYALRGLQAYAVTFSLWPAMARAYETLWSITNSWAAAGHPPVVALRDRLHGHIERVRKATYLARESWRVDRERVYGDMYSQCAIGLGLTGDGAGTPAHASLADRIAATPDRHSPPALQLRAMLEHHLGVEEGSVHAAFDCAALEAMLDCVMRFLRQTQAILRLATEIQRGINQLLGRPHPERILCAADLDIHNRLQGNGERRLPYLIDELGEVFGISIDLDADLLEITDRRNPVPI